MASDSHYPFLAQLVKMNLVMAEEQATSKSQWLNALQRWTGDLFSLQTHRDPANKGFISTVASIVTKAAWNKHGKSLIKS